MERDEAKAILELCRPGSSEDQHDPLIAEALGLLETDAGLKAWFDQQQALDARISESFERIEPPADLKASILAGMRAHRLRSEGEGVPSDLSAEAPAKEGATRPGAERTGTSEKVAILPGKHDQMDSPTTSPAWWRNPWIGVAAVFALLFFVVVIPKGNRDTQVASGDGPALQAGIPPMIQFLAGEIDALTSKQRSLEKRSSTPATLQAYLASAGAPSPSTLPESISGGKSIGCITFEYNGIKMGMICFKDGELMHLTTVKKADCAGEISDQPTIYEIRDQAFKVWIEGDQVHILSVHGSKEKLPEFI